MVFQARNRAYYFSVDIKLFMYGYLKAVRFKSLDGVRGAKEGNIQVTIQVGCRELIIYAKNNIAGLIIPCLVIGI